MFSRPLQHRDAFEVGAAFRLTLDRLSFAGSMVLVILSRRLGVLAMSRENTLPEPPLPLPPLVVRFFFSSVAAVTCTPATSLACDDAIGATLLFLLAALRRAVPGVVAFTSGVDDSDVECLVLDRIDVVRSGGVGRPRSIGDDVLVRLNRAGIVWRPNPARTKLCFEPLDGAAVRSSVEP